MSFAQWSCTMWRALFCLLTVFLVNSFISAQSPKFQLNQPEPGYSSSSSSYLSDNSDAESLSTATTEMNASGGNRGGSTSAGASHDVFSWSHLALEFGGGFNAPIGNDQPYITWGGNVTAGAGLHLSRRFVLLAEYQLIYDKLPGAFIAAAGQGANNGTATIQSITLAPVLDLFPKRTNSVYLTGGGGYYHKTTSFNILVCCDFYGYPISINTNKFSSSQAGGNFGFGFTHRIGGPDGQAKYFAEVRYLFVNTPPITETNGLGTTGLIPVTFGIRW